MSLRRFLSAFRSNRKGAAAMEFALLAPVVLSGMMAVFQVGIGMQNYNALRSISADVARFAVIDAQKNLTKQTNTELEDWAKLRAKGYPYRLHESRFTITVATAGVQRIAGATEKTITVNYDVDTLLKEFGVNDIHMTYSRPVFIVT
jgi:Flp pilus assembly protein TadG